MGDKKPPSRRATLAGLDVDLSGGVARHDPARAWRLYRATRCLRRSGGCTGLSMEVYIGHVFNFFMVCRPALAAVSTLDRVAERHRGNTSSVLTMPSSASSR